MKLTKAELKTLIKATLVEEGKGDKSKKMKRKKAQKRKKLNAKEAKELAIQMKAYYELKPTDKEIKQAIKMVKNGETVEEAINKRLAKIVVVIGMIAQLAGNVAASPLGDMLGEMSSPDLITFEGEPGLGEVTVDRLGDGVDGPQTFTIDCDGEIPDDILDVVKGGGQQAINDLAEGIFEQVKDSGRSLGIDDNQLVGMSINAAMDIIEG